MSWSAIQMSVLELVSDDLSARLPDHPMTPFATIPGIA